jgi:hypothetical protein
METSYKGDEGYSEDTRSLDDGDSTMGVEPRAGAASGLLPSALVALQNAIMALDEGQRSGGYKACVRRVLELTLR